MNPEGIARAKTIKQDEAFGFTDCQGSQYGYNRLSEGEINWRGEDQRDNRVTGVMG